MADEPRLTCPTSLPTPASSKNLATRFLQSAGLEIVCRDWQCAYGGLDLVARDAGITAFVTVIFSTGPGDDGRAAALSRTERQRIRRLALLWLTDGNGPWQRIRFDVVSVTRTTDGHPLITHDKAVF